MKAWNSLFIAVSVLQCISVFASCLSDEKPWLREKPKGSVFKYYVGIGSSATSPEESRRNAYLNAVEILTGELDVGRQVVGSAFSRNQDITTHNGTQDYKDRILNEIMVKGSSVSLPALEEFDSVSKSCADGYAHAVVLRYPKQKPDDDSTPPNPRWRSALVPGWGQISVGEANKGLWLLGSEAVLIPTTVIALVLAQNDRTLAGKQTTSGKKSFYNRKYYAESVAGLVAGSIATALYVYNLVDAWSWKPTNFYASNSSVIPSFNVPEQNSLGLAWSW